MRIKLAILIISWLYGFLRKKYPSLPTVEWGLLPLQFNLDWFQK